MPTNNQRSLLLACIHDELDAAVFEAYGWPADLADEEILQQLVDLNAERAEEESRGIIRWLRPEFQQKQVGRQGSLDLPEDDADDEPASEKPTRKAKGPRGASLPHPGPLPAGEGAKKKTAAAKVAKLAWPSSRVERTRAVQDALTRAAKPVTVDDLAKRFSRANKEQLTEILEALTALGLAKSIRGKYSA